MLQVILASGSPRRQELLRQINIEPIVHPSSFEESSGEARDAEAVVRANAQGKCLDVVAKYGDSLPVIAADTVVVLDKDILGKPLERTKAAAMLRMLSGRSHQVMTGVAISYQGKLITEVVKTEVVFRGLSDTEIAAYVATDEPLDKAGAYGIQGLGAILVERIHGCYNNVVGLPLTCVWQLLSSLGVLNEATEK